MTFGQYIYLKERNLYFFKMLSILFLFAFSSFAVAQTEKDTSSIYIHQYAPSIEVRIVKIAAKILLPKNSILRKLGNDRFVSEAAPIPKHFYSEFDIHIMQVNNRNVYSISPKVKKSGKYVLFLHGGAYINNIFRQHWNFASQIIRKTNCTFIIPDYPLAPASTYETALAFLDAIYRYLLSQADAKDIILMGDSAGGGLALAFAEKLKNDGMPQADQIILISPWLDVTMSNPDIREVQEKDVSLKADNLIMAGKAWAGKSDPGIYLISPINGSLENLPKLSVFIGTHDILYADCRKLKTLMEQKSIPMNYYEYPGMFHDWVMLVSLKESEFAISQICSLIEN